MLCTCQRRINLLIQISIILINIPTTIPLVGVSVFTDILIARKFPVLHITLRVRHVSNGQRLALCTNTKCSVFLLPRVLVGQNKETSIIMGIAYLEVKYRGLLQPRYSIARTIKDNSIDGINVHGTVRSFLFR